jgi:hypothetical protein
MIFGIHALIYSQDASMDREFVRDVLGLESIDSGGGWLIFALPPAELGIHPTDDPPRTELYLMCDDIDATVVDLRSKGVQFDGDIVDAGFGRVTTIRLPSGAGLPIYQPKHEVAVKRS